MVAARSGPARPRVAGDRRDTLGGRGARDPLALRLGRAGRRTARGGDRPPPSRRWSADVVAAAEADVIFYRLLCSYSQNVALRSLARGSWSIFRRGALAVIRRRRRPAARSPSTSDWMRGPERYTGRAAQSARTHMVDVARRYAVGVEAPRSESTRRARSRILVLVDEGRAAFGEGSVHSTTREGSVRGAGAGGRGSDSHSPRARDHDRHQLERKGQLTRSIRRRLGSRTCSSSASIAGRPAMAEVRAIRPAPGPARRRGARRARRRRALAWTRPRWSGWSPRCAPVTRPPRAGWRWRSSLGFLLARGRADLARVRAGQYRRGRRVIPRLTGRFADRLDQGLAHVGLRCPSFLLKSNGGHRPGRWRSASCCPGWPHRRCAVRPGG